MKDRSMPPQASRTPPHSGQYSSTEFSASYHNGHKNSSHTKVLSSFYSSPKRGGAQESTSTTPSTLTPLSEIRSDLFRAPAPPVEIKLFVGRVPSACDDAQLRSLFSEFGEVREVISIRDRDTGNHKGCAFVRMASITKADAAIRHLNNSKLLDPRLGPLQVKYAVGEPERLGIPIESIQPEVDQAKLFVGSIPRSSIEEDIQAVFSCFGDIDEVFLMRDGQKMSRGCAFVRFAFKEEALYAIANLNGKHIMPGGTRPIEVRFAESKKTQQQPYGTAPAGPFSAGAAGPTGWLEYVSAGGRPYYYCIKDGHTQWERPIEFDTLGLHLAQHPNIVPGGVGAQTHGPPGANVFVFHIPNHWTENDLVATFSPFGQIVSARIATDKSTGRRLGFGFVSYSTVEAAVQSVMALNGFSVAGKRLKVTIKRGEEQYATPFLPRGSFPLKQINAQPQLVSPMDSSLSQPVTIGSTLQTHHHHLHLIPNLQNKRNMSNLRFDHGHDVNLLGSAHLSSIQSSRGAVYPLRSHELEFVVESKKKRPTSSHKCYSPINSGNRHHLSF